MRPLYRLSMSVWRQAASAPKPHRSQLSTKKSHRSPKRDQNSAQSRPNRLDNYIQIDFITRRVWVKQEDEWQEVHFQRLQFELLKLLVINARRTLPTTTIIDHIWGKDVSTDVLGVYIHRLREKLELSPDQSPVYIENIRGLGYRFNGRPVKVSQATMDREHF